MSQTVTTPRGLDELSADEASLLDTMRDDAPDIAADSPPATETVTDETTEIELPGEEAPAQRGPRTETVPHAKFAAALAERKAAKAAADVAEKKAVEAESKRAEAEQKLATETVRINERIALLTALAQQPAQPAPAPVVVTPAAEEPLPDVNTDPIGHFRALADRHEKLRLADRAEMESLQGVLKGFQEQQQQARAVDELRAWGTAQEIAFQRQEPAYGAAMDYLRTNRDEELTELGITDPVRRQQVINEDITTIAQAARRDGVNFAERLFRQAQRRGFQKAAPPADPATPVIPPLDAEVAAVDRAARIEEGRANATTIGSLGAAPARSMSVEQILNLPDERFLEIAQKMREGGRLQDLMGS